MTSSWWSSGCRCTRSWFDDPTKAARVTYSYSWYKVLLIILLVWSNCNHFPWSTFFLFNLHPQYGLLSYPEIPCQLNPLISIHSPPLAVPSQFFLDFGESYFLLLEYQRSRGMPMEGRVITPNAAQSSYKQGDIVKWVRCKIKMQSFTGYKAFITDCYIQSITCVTCLSFYSTCLRLGAFCKISAFIVLNWASMQRRVNSLIVQVSALLIQ